MLCVWAVNSTPPNLRNTERLGSEHQTSAKHRNSQTLAKVERLGLVGALRNKDHAIDFAGAAVLLVVGTELAMVLGCTHVTERRQG